MFRYGATPPSDYLATIHMTFSADDRVLIKVPRQEKLFGANRPDLNANHNSYLNIIFLLLKLLKKNGLKPKSRSLSCSGRSGVVSWNTVLSRSSL